MNTVYPSPSPAEVQAARARSGMTQTQAAAAVRVTLRAWQAWEAGDRKMPPGLWELFNTKFDLYQIN